MHTHIHIETHTWLPSSTSGKEPARQCRRLWRCRLVSWISRKTPLEEGMASPSSILAWRIPWAEEPGGLQSMG